MGTIRRRVDADLDLTVNNAEGVLTIDEILGAVKAYLTADPTSKVLWDFYRADGSGISTEDLIQLYDIVRHRAPGNVKRKVAIVVSRDLGFGISRMAESQAGIAGITAAYYVTRSLEDAMAWLDVPVE
jgi:hypothetical protein